MTWEPNLEDANLWHTYNDRNDEPACCDMCLYFIALASNGEGVCNRYGMHTMTLKDMVKRWIDNPNETPRECSYFREYTTKEGKECGWLA